MVHLHLSNAQQTALPSELNYLPMNSAPEGSTAQYSRVSTDSSQYQAGNIISIRIPGTGQLFDVDNSFLSVDCTLSGGGWAATNTGISSFNQYSGINSIFSRVRLSAANGVTVIDSNVNYDYLMTVLNECLLDLGTAFHCVSSPVAKTSTTTIDNDNVGNNVVSNKVFSIPGQDLSMRYVQGVEPFCACPASFFTSHSGTVSNATEMMFNGDGKYDNTAGVCAALVLNPTQSNTRTFVVNPLSIFFNHGSVLPLTCSYTLELYLNTISTCTRVVQSSSTALSLTSQSYSIANVKYVMKTIKLPDEVRHKMDQVWKSSGLYVNLTNVQPYTGYNSSLAISNDTIRINSYNKRSVTGFLLAPRLSSLPTIAELDSYRRYHPDFQDITIKVGQNIADPIQSDAECYRHTQNLFGGMELRNFADGQSNTYYSSERGYFVNYNLGTSQDRGAEWVLNTTANNRHKWFSSWCLGFDLKTFDTNEIASGLSNQDLEISYRLKSNPGTGTGAISWIVFLFYQSMLKLSYDGIAEIAS